MDTLAALFKTIIVRELKSVKAVPQRPQSLPIFHAQLEDAFLHAEAMFDAQYGVTLDELLDEMRTSSDMLMQPSFIISVMNEVFEDPRGKWGAVVAYATFLKRISRRLIQSGTPEDDVAARLFKSVELMKEEPTLVTVMNTIMNANNGGWQVFIELYSHTKPHPPPPPPPPAPPARRRCWFLCLLCSMFGIDSV
jgi:hypothetical protein